MVPGSGLLSEALLCNTSEHPFPCTAMLNQVLQTQAEIDACTARIRSQLKSLRSDEVASIAQNVASRGTILDQEIIWLRHIVIGNSVAFVKYFVRTWSIIVIGLISGRFDFSAFLSVLFFGTSASFALGIIHIWCIIANAPLVVNLYRRTLGHLSGHLSIVNATNPMIFKSLQKNQCQAAKRKLSASPSAARELREFDIDIAKFLLQLSSIMYERSTTGFNKALHSARETLRSGGRHTSDTADTSDPGGLLTSIFDDAAVSEIAELLREDDDELTSSSINTFVNDYNICYEPLSELASTNQAYCSLFWEPGGDWVVVAFKGTGPAAFDEWITDFTVTFIKASAEIPGFHHVHQGFKERLFPRDQERSPYDTIAAGIKIATDELSKGKPPGTKIHVWFTGHSLGTAIASLAYSKALLSMDIGSNALLRDAYLFATPVVSDTVSREALYKGLHADPDVARSMWRVTNRNDFVATGLPSLGDFRDVDLDSENLFNFCHLGIEIYLRSPPAPCQVQGQDRLLPRPRVVSVDMKSDFSSDGIKYLRQDAVLRGLTVKKMFLAAQYIPFIGRLAAHTPVNYWDQLDQITPGRCVARPDEWWE